MPDEAGVQLTGQGLTESRDADVPGDVKIQRRWIEPQAVQPLGDQPPRMVANEQKWRRAASIRDDRWGRIVAPEQIFGFR